MRLSPAPQPVPSDGLSAVVTQTTLPDPYSHHVQKEPQSQLFLPAYLDTPRCHCRISHCKFDGDLAVYHYHL